MESAAASLASGSGAAPGPRLTPTERSFLDYLVARPSQVVSEAELLREVWGYHPSVRSKAVQLTVSRLRRKLGAELTILTVPGVGYGLRTRPFPSARGYELARLAGVQLSVASELAALRADLEEELRSTSTTDREAHIRIALAACAYTNDQPFTATPLWALAERLAAGPLGVECAVWAARLTAVAGDTRSTLALLRPWLERITDDPAWVAVHGDLLSTLSNHALLAGELDEASRHTTSLLELACRYGDPTLRAFALANRARLDLRSRPDDRRALTNLRDAVTLLEGVGAVVDAAITEGNLGAALYRAGRLDEAKRRIAHAGDVLAAAGRVRDAALALVNLGTAELAAGEISAAEARARRALASFEAVAEPVGEAFAQLLLGRCRALCGDPEAALAFERAAELGERHGREAVAAHARRYLAWCDQRAGRHPTYRTILGDELASRFVGLWQAWADGVEDTPALAALTALLGASPLDPPAPGPAAVDVRLTRLLWQGRAP